MSLLFYPRGGSSQVVRYLVPALEESGWPVALVAGSLGEPGERTHAESFFKHPRLTTVDYGPALQAHAQGRDPLAEPVPHASVVRGPSRRSRSRAGRAASGNG